jgi:RNA polymerase sigma-54 factor
MRLGYDLTIEQTQKLVMTPELIQAIQILQFNTQELESYVEEQLLTNPVLDLSPPDTENHEKDGSVPESTIETSAEKHEEELHSSKGEEIDWAEYF